MSKPYLIDKIPITNDRGVIPLRAKEGVRSSFRKWKHSPSEEEWNGLDLCLGIMDCMAFKTIESRMYVSFMPCGSGKTTCIIEYVKALLSTDNDAVNDAGVIIFLGRLADIGKMTNDMGLSEADYSVITGKNNIELNSLGNQHKTKARVLFTTQQMLERKVDKLKSFNDMTDLYYNGKPRRIKIWDEAILPAKILTIDPDDLLRIIRDMRDLDHELADMLRHFCNVLYSREDGDFIDMPELEEQYGIAREEAEDTVKHEDDRETIRALYAMQGMRARVSKDNTKKVITLQYADILPTDLAPMLILDAGGQNSATYEFWFNERGGLAFLKSPQKSYDGYGVFHGDMGSGKSAHDNRRKDYKDIALGVARVVDSFPKNEKVLVIHHKKSKYINDMEKEIRHRTSCAKTADDRVKFITWGNHKGTNDFQEFEHVILAGVMHYSTAQVQAHAYAAKGRGVEKPLTREEYDFTRLSEFASHILQAACRGKVRHSENGKCPSGCTLHILYSTRGGIPGKEFMEDVFPGCSYNEWEPVPKLQGPKQKAIAATLSKIGKVKLKTLMEDHKIERPNQLNAILIAINKVLNFDRKLQIQWDKTEVRIERHPDYEAF